jgi:hypothetical protein
VLVSNVEFVQGTEKMIFWGGAEVRLLRPDEIGGASAYALYSSVITNCGEMLFLQANGESVLASWGATVLEHQCRDQVVETGSQLVDDFSGQNRQARWDRGFSFDYEAVLQALFLKFADDFVWGGTLKRGHLDIELPDCFVGPLNFGSNAVEPMRHRLPAVGLK